MLEESPISWTTTPAKVAFRNDEEVSTDPTNQLPQLTLSPSSSASSSSSTSTSTTPTTADSALPEIAFVKMNGSSLQLDKKQEKNGMIVPKPKMNGNSSKHNTGEQHKMDNHGSVATATATTAAAESFRANGTSKENETLLENESHMSTSSAQPQSLPSKVTTSFGAAVSSRPPAFSSDQDEPIIMSRDALATVLHDVQQADSDDGDDTVLPLLLMTRVNTLKLSTSKPTAASSSSSSDFSTGACSYSLGTLTRQYSQSALSQLISWMVGDLFCIVALRQSQPCEPQTALRTLWHWPMLVQRMLRLIWQWGPTFEDYPDNHNNNAAITLPRNNFLQLSSSPSPSSTLPPIVHGIPNYGQTCFLNVILQSMASLDSVMAYAEWIAMEQQRRQEDDDDHYDQDDDDDDGHDEGVDNNRHSQKRWRRRRRRHKKVPTTTVSQLLFPMLQSLNGQCYQQPHQRKSTIDPRELLWRIAQKNPQFQSSRHHLFGGIMSSSAAATGEQQDAQELLQALLEMMIVDAYLESSITTTTTLKKSTPSSTSSSVAGNEPKNSESRLDHWAAEEKKDDNYYNNNNNGVVEVLEIGGGSSEEDDLLTVLSDRRSPRSSSNNSACSSVGSSDDEEQQQQQRLQLQRKDDEGDLVGTGSLSNTTDTKEEKTIRHGNLNTKNLSDSAWNYVHMVDASGMISSYNISSKFESGMNGGYSATRSRPVSSSSLAASSSLENNSLASSFLSTTSTVVTSPAAHSRQRQQQHQQQGPTMSASMQIMLSTISSITKTPLSCWTGSLVQCQACRHVKAVRNQEWRDIPIVPTAVSAPMVTAARMGPPSKNHAYVPPPCTLEECLQNFTQVERVEDVECGNCTLQLQINKWQEEVQLLQEVFQSLERKREKRQQSTKGVSSVEDSGPNSELSALLVELQQAELKLYQLQQQDPDEYDPAEIYGAGKDNSHDYGGYSGFGDATAGPARMVRANALKCLVLTRLPSVLCLHVQRRCYDPLTNRMSKTVQHVAFDEVLDLAPYCAFGGNENARKFFNLRNSGGQSFNKRDGTNMNSDSQHRSSILYRLTSVVEHRGNAFGGHYVCYRRLPGRFSQPGSAGEWFFCSDETIDPVTWNEVRKAQAYMLFYEAI